MRGVFREIPSPPSRLFCIGDIHGCIDEIETLIRFLERELKLTLDDQLIFVGDYIDRGPDSSAVLTLMSELKEYYPQAFFLRGNHELMLQGWLDDTPDGDFYIVNGGRETLRSYGVNVGDKEDFRLKLPEKHASFLHDLDWGLFNQNFIFVHAGIHPGRTFEAQQPLELAWIREEFIQNTHQLGRIVVFGHTPFNSVTFDLPYKIGIDTGLVYGNSLSCIELVSGEIFAIARGGSQVKKEKFPSGYDWKHLRHHAR